jgi:hypothetical protein
MINKNYTRSTPYERFICSARLCSYEKHNAHQANMHNLPDADEGKKHIFYSHAKLLGIVKKAMISATKYALRKRKLSKNGKAVFLTYLDRIDLATTGDMLLDICNEGRELLLKYRAAFQ